MRISDWSSDVCSSDLATGRARSRQLFGASLASNPITQSRLAEMVAEVDASALLIYRAAWTHDVARRQNRDRKSVVSGKSVSVRVDLGGRLIIKKKSLLLLFFFFSFSLHFFLFL